MAKNKEVVSLSLAPQIIKQLKAIAEMEDVSFSELAKRIFNAYIEKWSDENE